MLALDQQGDQFVLDARDVLFLNDQIEDPFGKYVKVSVFEGGVNIESRTFLQEAHPQRELPLMNIVLGFQKLEIQIVGVEANKRHFI
jgi:hypothetical protein